MFGRDLVLPSLARAPAYDSGRDPADAAYAMPCSGCAVPVAVSFADLLGRGLDYERELGAEAAARAVEHFGVGAVGKSHEGGWPAFLRVQCPTCGATYLVYAGVREPANGWLRVTIQGVAELADGRGAG